MKGTSYGLSPEGGELCWLIPPFCSLSKPKMNVVHALRSERRAGPGVEAMERPNLRAVDQLSPEIKVEKYVLLSLDGKLLGPELSRIRSGRASRGETGLEWGGTGGGGEFGP